MNHPLDVLIVDDSPTARGLLEHIIESASDMRVVATAKDGNDAIEKAQDLRPHIILMDIIMPNRDGLDATREIMAEQPTPIVLISASLEDRETEVAFEAMNAGALAVHRKPDGINHPEHAAQVAILLNKLRLMADVRVIHHRRRNLQETLAEEKQLKLAKIQPLTHPPQLIAIVSSTGGPAALTQILQRLPAHFAIPIVIVQHISGEFTGSLARWMSSVTPLRLGIAQHDEFPEPGCVYIAPGNGHLRLTSSLRFQIDPDPAGEAHVPSGNVLLESVARVYGSRAIGVVLTGIGSDGAQGLRAMYEAGAFTIAQDEQTSVVYGMPKSAYQLGAVRQVLPLGEMADALVTLCNVKEKHTI